MENLHLPHPNRISVALPANLRSGRPADGGLEEADDWVAHHREARTVASRAAR